jgi:KUP system potassium uptake protein
LRRPAYLAAMSLGALGVVYGDIGTSPLYALRESFDNQGLAVMRENILGVLSLVFWSLLIVISLKYLTVVMRADNEGEGGILALTALILPPQRALADRRQRGLILVGLFGTALLFGDGMITPAISVLSAVEGIKVATPVLTHYVVPIAVLILLGLFMIQRHGTRAVGRVFGPVMVVWFSILAVLGLPYVVQSPEVLFALNPVHAVEFFINNGWKGFLTLGSVFLVVTGSEALYADMGHFGRRPIETSWYVVVFPALLLTYFGQGAFLLGHPDGIENPFYLMAPDWAVWPLVVVATGATIVASQALISGAFSLTMQAIQLGYLPRMRIVHTSATEPGQVYIPTMNWALMVAAVGLVLGFRSSSNLAGAYGVAVATTMVITTMLIHEVMRVRWGWSSATAGAVAGGFFVVDLAYFASNLFKIPDGGWFPLLIGLGVFTLMTTWKRGRELLANALRRDDLPIEKFVGSVATAAPGRVPGTAVYMFSHIGTTPPSLLANLRYNNILHETVVVVSVTTADVPRVPGAARAHVWNLGVGFFQIVLEYGFMEAPNVPRALAGITRSDFGIDPSETIYVLGREQVMATAVPGMAIWREKLFSLLARNAGNAVRYFRLPSDRSIEIGVTVEI